IAKPMPSALPAPVTIAVCPANCTREIVSIQVDRFLDRTLCAGNGKKFWIKLHKTVLDGRVPVMATPAIIFAGSHCASSLCRAIEIEISPLVAEARLVFHFDIEAMEVVLEAAVFVNGAARSRAVDFQDEHGLVGPRAVSNEIIVSGRGDEDVG